MFHFTAQQRLSALARLSLFHILIITSSNYLVQLPISIFGFHTTWGAFTFPFIFLATDLTVRIFGAPLARRIILTVMVPALVISYVVSALFYQGEWRGFSALASVNIVIARIACASFMAYVLGQILDVHVFNRLRQRKAWWVASTLFGNLSDTLAFFFIAFYRSTDAFMAANWVEIALVDYTFKLLISLLFFLPMYGVMLNMLLKRLSESHLCHSRPPPSFPRRRESRTGETHSFWQRSPAFAEDDEE
ncbi:7-cyano-7-deazaguanine/7-aminomethyl-7-deazaguanine transporter [Candidatus Symbiopectobacterium endolongispinus]|nr:7-cyano-7-deazaguanine/7-aminomethyl-7-deazaguanine transporter [Candidatus Symbiopectobacterium endolongispinus]